MYFLTYFQFLKKYTCNIFLILYEINLSKKVKGFTAKGVCFRHGQFINCALTIEYNGRTKINSKSLLESTYRTYILSLNISLFALC